MPRASGGTSRACSSYARQFLGQMQKPKVEHISGLSPAIGIEQKTTSKSPRSTVGTVTEIYDYLRILLRPARPAALPATATSPIGTQTADEIVDKILRLPEGTKLYLMAPVERRGGEKYDTLWDELRAAGLRAGARRRQVVQPRRAADDRPPPQARGRGRRRPQRSSGRRPASRHRRRGRDGARPGQGRVHVAHVDDDVRRAAVAGRPLQPAPRLRQLRPQLRAAHAAQLLVQQPARLVPGLRRPGHAARGEPRRPDPRRPAEPPPRARSPSGPTSTPTRCSPGCSRRWPRHAGFALDTPFDDLDGRHRRTILHGTGDDWFAVPGRRSGAARVLVPVQGPLPGDRRGGAGLVRLPLQAPEHRRRGRLRRLRRRRLRDDAAAVRFRGLHARPDRRLAARASRSTFFETLEASTATSSRSPASWSARSATGCSSWSTSGSITSRSAGGTPTLSGGESQRIRLASQIGSGLTGVLYVLDEPTIGLHPRDNARLLGALQQLRDLGNTLVLVEHDREVIEAADHLLDFGPGAGDRGGEITAAGTPAQGPQGRRTSLTGQYLSGKKAIPVPTNRRPADADGQPRLADRRGAPGSTTSRTSTCAFPLGHVHRRHRASAARARARWSTTSSTTRSPASCTGPGTAGGGHDDDRRARADRQGHQRRSAPARQHADLEPGDLHRRAST